MNQPDSTQNNISVVIPVYNSEDTLDELISRLNQVLPAISQTYETILVNDGSSDQTLEVLFGLRENDPRVCIIDFTRNFGQQNSISAGLVKNQPGVKLNFTFTGQDVRGIQKIIKQNKQVHKQNKGKS